MSETNQNVVIIGGGIIGLASAHFLQRSGHSVTIIDQNTIGGGCSHGACGLVSPSHVLPLAEPGTIAATMKTAWRSQSPLRVKPRLDVSLIRWMWNFSRRCNEGDMIESARAIHPLLVRSRKLYEDLVHPDAEGGPLACSWEKRGLLFVYRDDAAMNKYEPTNDLLTEQFNEPAQRLSGQQLTDLEPALRDDVAGAWFFADDAHFRPDQLIDSWVSSLRGSGVTFIQNAKLESVEQVEGRVTSAVVRQGSSLQCIDGDKFLVATGAWTPKLAGILDYTIPIQPGKGYSMTFKMPPNAPRTPMIFPQHRVAVTPMTDRLRLGSIMEFAGYDDSIRPERLKLLTEGAKAYLKEPPTTEIKERWQGWRPMTYDSTPVIDRCPTFNNLYIAAGHNMLGLSMAPATGEMISQLISNQTTQLEAKRYRADRF